MRSGQGGLKPERYHTDMWVWYYRILCHSELCTEHLVSLGSLEAWIA